MSESFPQLFADWAALISLSERYFAGPAAVRRTETRYPTSLRMTTALPTLIKQVETCIDDLLSAFITNWDQHGDGGPPKQDALSSLKLEIFRELGAFLSFFAPNELPRPTDPLNDPVALRYQTSWPSVSFEDLRGKLLRVLPPELSDRVDGLVQEIAATIPAMGHLDSLSAQAIRALTRVNCVDCNHWWDPDRRSTDTFGARDEKWERRRGRCELHQPNPNVVNDGVNYDHGQPMTEASWTCGSGTAVMATVFAKHMEMLRAKQRSGELEEEQSISEDGF